MYNVLICRYALIAGLPPVYGLYSAFLPLVVYGILGTGRQLAVGPVAVLSLLTASSIAQFKPASAEEYIAYALAITILSGCIQIVIGVLRLGFVVNFISHAVLSGFTSASGITFFLSIHV